MTSPGDACRERYAALGLSAPELFETRPDDPLQLLLDDADIARAEAAAAQNLSARQQSTEWCRVGVVYEDPYVRILRDAVRFPDGRYGTYIRILHSAPGSGGVGGVAVLPVSDGRVLLFRHFRHASRTWHLEIPRGFVDGVDPETAALRELAEETGTQASALIDLGKLSPDSGLLGSEVRLYLARIDSAGPARVNDGQEPIEGLRWVELAELRDLIASGAITDSFTIAAFARASLRKLLD